MKFLVVILGFLAVSNATVLFRAAPSWAPFEYAPIMKTLAPSVVSSVPSVVPASVPLSRFAWPYAARYAYPTAYSSLYPSVYPSAYAYSSLRFARNAEPSIADAPNTE